MTRRSALIIVTKLAIFECIKISFEINFAIKRTKYFKISNFIKGKAISKHL